MFQGILLQVVLSSHYDQPIPSTNIMQNLRGRPGACWCLELTDALNLCMLSKATVPFLYDFIKLEELQLNFVVVVIVFTMFLATGSTKEATFD